MVQVENRVGLAELLRQAGCLMTDQHGMQRSPQRVRHLLRDRARGLAQAARQLEACLASVAFAQEILVVDSGSTDGTVELADKHGAELAAAVDKVLAGGMLPVAGPLRTVFDRVRDYPGVTIEFTPEPMRAGSATHHFICAMPGGIRLEFATPVI